MSELLDGISADHVTCWTVQKAAVWRQLQQRGRFSVTPHRIDLDFRPTYDWLREQHRRRVPGATGRYPIWAYARITRSDLRHFCQFQAQWSPSSVLLVCRLPRASVSLTDYDTWHIVLNNGYLDPSDDYDAMETWCAIFKHPEGSGFRGFYLYL